MRPHPEFSAAKQATVVSETELRAIETELLDRLPAQSRDTALRRILAALTPAENAALLSERCADAATWLYSPRHTPPAQRQNLHPLHTTTSPQMRAA